MGFVTEHTLKICYFKLIQPLKANWAECVGAEFQIVKSHGGEHTSSFNSSGAPVEAPHHVQVSSNVTNHLLVEVLKKKSLSKTEAADCPALLMMPPRKLPPFIPRPALHCKVLSIKKEGKAMNQWINILTFKQHVSKTAYRRFPQGESVFTLRLFGNQFQTQTLK